MKLIKVLALGALLAGCGQAKDDGGQIEMRIDGLLSQMTLQEKIGQLQQNTLWGKIDDKTLQLVKDGKVGSFLNVDSIADKNALQKAAMENSRLKIPLLFGRDVIHGYRTIFPIPLAQSCSWNPELVKKAARIAAVECSSTGYRWTFAPMIDISRDARWGRIAETTGEDQYLTSIYAKAMVEGFQGSDYTNLTAVAACAKHYVGYGAAEGGRDYNTTFIPEQMLREVYLPSFKAATDAGVLTFMSSFNEINGVPASGNEFTLRHVLRSEWNFKGFVVSDWGSMEEMINHGFCADKNEVAQKSIVAGIDMEMVTTCFAENLEKLVKDGKVSENLINDAVRNILRVKFQLGLFENPYVKEPVAQVMLTEAHKQAAKELAMQSTVLLKNEGILPLQNIKSLALIGSLANDGWSQMGCWAPDGRKDESVTILKALTDNTSSIAVNYAKGTVDARSMDKSLIAEAVAAARKSDVAVIVCGEDAGISGEAHSRAFIRLPGMQEELIAEVTKTGKPVVLVVLAGRPLIFNTVADKVQAILYAWHPGTMGGPAIADLLLGKTSPSGRLTTSFVKAEGQIPTYYNHKNTGRPPSINNLGIPAGSPLDPKGFVSSYIDLDFTPQYPFGYGLTYSKIEYKNLALASKSAKVGDSIVVTADIANTGKFDVDEVVQLYIRDLFASVTRPVKELKGFQRIALKAGETKKVSFTIKSSDLAFIGNDMKPVTEAGKFHVWVAPNAAEGLQGEFELTK
jgi:beta-glucosidase